MTSINMTRAYRPGPIALLAALLAWALSPSPAAATQILTMQEGVAQAARGSTVLYREQHFLRSAGGQPLERVVLYRCAAGVLFGRKRVDYRASATAPSFRLDDQRSGYSEGLRLATRGRELFFRAGSGSPERSAPVRAASLIADAGFDQFIEQRWSSLLDGKAQVLEFAIPSRLRSMAFSVKRTGATTIGAEPAWVFQLKLEGLLGLVAPVIQVSYSQRSRRLLRFEGLSNVRNDRGDQPLLARIDFPSAAAPASEAQWRAALEAPLATCRTGQ